MKNKIYRPVAGILGILFIIFGIHLLISPLMGTFIEKLNIITFLLIGVVFIIFAIRGKVSKSLDE